MIAIWPNKAFVISLSLSLSFLMSIQKNTYRCSSHAQLLPIHCRSFIRPKYNESYSNSHECTKHTMAIRRMNIMCIVHWDASIFTMQPDLTFRITIFIRCMTIFIVVYLLLNTHRTQRFNESVKKIPLTAINASSIFIDLIILPVSVCVCLCVCYFFLIVYYSFKCKLIEIQSRNIWWNEAISVAKTK